MATKQNQGKKGCAKIGRNKAYCERAAREDRAKLHKVQHLARAAAAKAKADIKRANNATKADADRQAHDMLLKMEYERRNWYFTAPLREMLIEQGHINPHPGYWRVPVRYANPFK